MAQEERIMTLHPTGKAGVNILKSKYQVIKDFIIDCITKHESITFGELTQLATKQLSNHFDGKVGWYIVTVKLDLEARHLIERMPSKGPQRLQLKNK